VLEDEFYLQTDFDRKVAKIYQAYEETLKENNYVDFNDLLLKTYHLFETNAEVLNK
jgi:DNA helicase-2/ATP-dependent DNA helicase PcrA